MNSAALLLMLAVRIYADNVEGPTGKTNNEKGEERNVVVWFWMVSSKHARFCVILDDAVVACAFPYICVIQMLLLKLNAGSQPLLKVALV